MTKFQNSLLVTAALREHVPPEMRPLFDHLINLAKHSHSNPLYAKRAGRELRMARRLAKTGDVVPLRIPPFADVYGSEGIVGAYELPPMSDHTGGAYELPFINGRRAPTSVAGSMWEGGGPLGQMAALRGAGVRRSPGVGPAFLAARSMRPLSAVAGASYAIECAGYLHADRVLQEAAGAMLAGWPAGSEFNVACCGGGGPMVVGASIYDDIANTYRAIEKQFGDWGAKLTPKQKKALLDVAHHAQTFANGSGRWPSFETFKRIIRQVRAEALGPNKAQDDFLENAHFKWLGDQYGKGSIFGSIADAVSSAAKSVGSTVSSAAATLVEGVKKYNPVALAKVAAIKAKALAGDIANSVVFKTLGAFASSALAPALSVIKATVGPILPYVQSVISFVPGVGTGISAALGAAQALADGRSITEAIVAGAKGMLPGGPLAATAFDAAWGLAHGRPIDSVALEALRNQLPGDLAKKAFDTGLALATAKNAQERRNALGTAALGAIASNVPLPSEVTSLARTVQQTVAPAVNVVRQVQQTVAPAVAAVQKAQQAVQTAQRAIATAKTVQNLVATRNVAAAAAIAKAAALAKARAAAAHH